MIKLSVAFMGGTSIELEIESFMVDQATRILACKAPDGDFVFPLENLRYWRMVKKGIMQ